MKMPLLTRRQVLYLAGGALLTSHLPTAFAQSDGGVALLVGMDQYPLLTQSIANLSGAGSNSVTILTAALKEKCGFDKVIPLINPRKQDFLDAIRKYSIPGKPFVVYFIGHGARTQPGEGLLLFRDSVENDEHSPGDLSRTELNAALMEVAAHGISVTCLLDSCHSWAMAAKALGTGLLADPNYHVIPLFYDRSQNIAKDLQAGPRDNGSPDAGGNNGNIPCFLTAADEAEQAYVCSIKDGYYAGQYIGLFTNAFALALKELPPSRNWSEIHGSVTKRSADIATKMSVAIPHPRLTPEFNTIVPFASLPGTRTAPSERISLDRFFSNRSEDKGALRLSINPVKAGVNPKHIKVNEQFDIEIELNRSGYLLLIEQTPQRILKLQYPNDSSVQSAWVDKSEVLLPLDRTKAFFQDGPGTDTVKAFLFPSESANQVQELINLFHDQPRISADNTKDIGLTARTDDQPNGQPSGKRSTPVTAEHSFLVTSA